MIVKILGIQTVRFTDCDSAIVKISAMDIEGVDNSYELICSFSGGKDIAIPLCENDQVYFLNNNGKTIDKDFRMCKTSLT